MAKKTSNIGLVGYGFMGRAHSNAFRQAERFFDLPFQPVLKAICARNTDRARGVCAQLGLRERRERLADGSSSARTSISSTSRAPNDMHHDIAIAAARAGKMVLCEKPLGRNAGEVGGDGRRPSNRQASPTWSGTTTAACRLSRCCKALIAEGKLGRIFHYRAKFLQDWTISQDLPQGGEGLWRLDVNVAGSGVTGDLLAHCIDTALWLNGPIAEVTAMTETFIKQRTHNLTGNVEPVGIDDASAFLARFRERIAVDLRSDALRARSQGALHARDQRRARVGALGPARSSSPAVVRSRDEGRTRGWRSIHITDGDHPYMKHWWVPGLQIGYEHSFTHQFADFLQAVARARRRRRRFATACRPITSPMRC